LSPVLLPEMDTAAGRKEVVSETEAASELHQMVVNAEAHKKRVRSERNALWVLLGVIFMAGGTGWLIGDFQSAGQVDAFMEIREQAASPTTTLPPVVTKEASVTPSASADSQVAQPDAGMPEVQDDQRLSVAGSADPVKNDTVKDSETGDVSLQKAAEEERMAQQHAAELKREAEKTARQKQESDRIERERRAAEQKLAKQREAELKREAEKTARLKQESDRMKRERRAAEQRLAKQREARKELERKARLERKKMGAAKEAAKKLAEERIRAAARLSETAAAKSLPQEPVRPGKAPASFQETGPSAYDEDDGDAIVLETKARLASDAPESVVKAGSVDAGASFPDTSPPAYDEDDGDAIVQSDMDEAVEFAANPCQGPTARFLSTCR
jgi:hypothetical protein